MCFPMKICSDVDGVILNYVQGFIDFTRNEKIPYSYNPELYGVISNFEDNVKIRNQFYSGEYLSKLKFYDDSLDVLNLLASKHELHLVSALEPEQADKRVENLKMLNYTTLQCVGDDRKEEVVVEEIQPDLMIEDRPELIEAFHQAGIKVIFPDWHPYTKGMERFATAFSLWIEVPFLLQNLLTTD